MLEVYSWPTPNGHKVHIMLEECGLPYRVHAVDIGAGDHQQPHRFDMAAGGSHVQWGPALCSTCMGPGRAC